MIEGLHGRQIATYFKAHHCAIDGMAAMHLMNSMYSNDPNAEVTISPFSEQALLEYKARVQQGHFDGGAHKLPTCHLGYYRHARPGIPQRQFRPWRPIDNQFYIELPGLLPS